MNIKKVKFFRTQKHKKQGRWEEGIIINDDMLIIDAKGKAVTAPIWDYIRLTDEVCVNVALRGE